MTTIPAPLFPLTFAQREQSVDSDTFALTAGSAGSPVFFPTNPDEEIIIPFRVSLNQHVAILSAIDVGAALAYTDDQLRVYYWYARNFGASNMELCDYIQACIGAQLDAIQASIDELSTSVTNISNVVNNIETSTDNSAAKPPLAITFTDNSFICGGALALVDFMHAKNMQVYAQAEASAVDNISEQIIAVLSSIPALETLPVGALGALTQSYFENQVTVYESDFALARVPMASLLACLIEANDGEMTYDVWGDWLESVETEVPANSAAEIFARYSPARQTIINQIAALINADQSLQAYFNELFVAYNAGEDNPSNACSSCSTGLEWDFTGGSQHGWIIRNPPNRGAWNGNGWITNTTDSRSVYIARTIGSAATITRCEIDYDVSSGTQNSPDARFAIFAGQLIDLTNAALTVSSNTPLAADFSMSVAAAAQLITDVSFTTGSTVTVIIKRIRVYFSGAIPSDWGGTEI